MVGYGIDWYLSGEGSGIPQVTTGLQGNVQIVEESPIGLYKMVAGFLGVVLMFKLFQIGSKSILSKPTIND